MDLHEVGCCGIDLIWLARDRERWRAIVNAVTNIRVQLNAENCLTSYKPVSFSRRTLLLGVRKGGKVSHPYKITGKITVACTFMAVSVTRVIMEQVIYSAERTLP
jgi:hypothetical protein